MTEPTATNSTGVYVSNYESVQPIAFFALIVYAGTFRSTSVPPAPCPKAFPFGIRRRIEMVYINKRELGRFWSSQPSQ